MSRSIVCVSECLPDTWFERTNAIRPFRADECRLRIPLMEEVLRGENVRVRRIAPCLPIGGESGEKIIIIFLALRAGKEVVKERAGAFVVLPKYREIVHHEIPFCG